MVHYRNQLLLSDNTWNIRYKRTKNDPHYNSSTDWALVILNFTVGNYGNRLIYDEIETAHGDLSLSNNIVY